MDKNLFEHITRGVEKENLRITRDGQLSFKAHPAALGKALTHPMITTDFAESLPEIVTSPLVGRKALFEQLDQINTYLVHHLENEMLWPLSMPPRIDSEDDIQIADYGQSHIGQLKHLYRVGLTHRYGKMMQVIAGIHYNFSFPAAFFEQFTNGLTPSESYFALLRNFYRFYWILPYLFGASPACDLSMLKGRSCQTGLDQLDEHTLVGEYATSLRMSDIGYQNQAQSQIAISTDDVTSYSKSLIDAINTPYAPFSKITPGPDGMPRQINANLLQIENEFYSPIRPKQISESAEQPSHALCRRGVRYIEVRVLDLNPFTPLGITRSQSTFMDLFLTHCAIGSTEHLTRDDFLQCKYNFKQAVCRGREANCTLKMASKSIALRDAAFELFEQMQTTAKLMDKHAEGEAYTVALSNELKKIEDVNKTPSAMLINLMQSESLSHQSLGLKLAQEHFLNLDEHQLPADYIQKMENIAQKSRLDERELLVNSTGSFTDYLKRINNM